LWRKDGTCFQVEFSTTPVQAGSDILGAVVVFRDVTERKAFASQLEWMATHDALTGLPNRTYLLNSLRAALQRQSVQGGVTAVIFADLDRFKVVNDGLGHATGDRLLAAVGARLQSLTSENGTVARFGGDEFVILLEGCKDIGAITRTAERIEAAFAAPLNVRDQELYTTLSMGIAVLEGSDQASLDAIPDLMRGADLAMYRAKDRGRACFELFDDTLRAVAARHIETERALRHAVEREELRVHYQPKVDLSTGGVSGTEALIRWQRGDQMVPPNDFIPIAEDTGHIVAIGAWILEVACRQTVAWQHELGQPGLSIAVNISGRQLTHPNFIDHVTDIIRRTAIDPRCVVLEITETILIDAGAQHSMDLLCQLKALGVRLSIDDFGTGYSSLSYLRDMPVDQLKIDRSFVRRLDDGDATIVAAVIGLAHALHLEVVAEGIETQGQYEMLRQLSCNTGQGFLMARPLAPEAALATMRALSAQDTSHQTLHPEHLARREKPGGSASTQLKSMPTISIPAQSGYSA
jgi:diguanylate cyclase (GGDEF)-like protein